VPDEFVSAFCWSGEPAEVAERVAEIAQLDGVSEIGFWVLRAAGQSLPDAVRLVAEEVVPVVRGSLAGAR
jgi:hypothetical protein